ncbi:molecular chaperone DnaJ [Silvanigrella aquatica]|uniref:Chaperone protein DnaJ n=1 Tax=Silvanigrella aquatica TaxID=1915309 RepID=A0A1L4D484_9BACT|nr:molecular chaperone DnaJ [Silvanigrella aquatica]APJ04977.1 molecular chaperone DnaJ [Silvanigrella aquatica]
MTTKRNYYEILQVSKSASADEIKKAYRKLAVQYHPDRNPGDKVAEEKFKEAAEAYEVLSDPAKRQRFDQFGHAGVSGNGFGGAGFGNVDDVFEHFGSIFEDLFGMGGGRKRGGGNRARKGGDLRYDLKVSFKESVLGTEKKIQIPRKTSCTSCEGSGAAKGTKPVTCSTCRGQGQVAVQQGFFTYASTCPDCNGSGKSISTPCGDCKGTGFQTKSSNINVKIPAGIDTGMRLRVSGEGEGGINGGTPGDLYVFIEVEASPQFKREDFDLVYSLKIGVAQAILGTDVSIDCFEDEPRQVEIPAGIQPGQRLVIQGAGIPKLEKYGRGKGDLIIEVNVEIPMKVNKEAEEHLRAFAQKVGQNVKNNNGFFDKIFG